MIDYVKIDSLFEHEVTYYKNFYKKYFLQHASIKTEILQSLRTLTSRFQALKDSPTLGSLPEHSSTLPDIEAFLKKYFGKELLSMFKKKPEYSSNWDVKKDDGFFATLGKTLMVYYEEKTQINESKLVFLNYMVGCLENHGLHHYILKRDPRIYKRFNIIVTYKEGKNKIAVTRNLLSQNEMENEYLGPYYKNKPVLVNGEIIHIKLITSIKITTTLLLDDELELFAHMKGFIWNDTQKETVEFSKNCFDETNNYFKNPNVGLGVSHFKNNSLTYVNQSRISELKSIKSKEFDLLRLITLCEELNHCSTMGSTIAVAALQRSIINFIPPIFGYKAFEQVVSNFAFGQSIKKSLLNLNNSMKNISDNHMHVQASETDAIPNITQVDFSNDIDVLLAEVSKKLKK